MIRFILAVAVCGAAARAPAGLGDRLLSQYMVYESWPLTADAARAQGYAPLNGACVPGAGVAYALGGVAHHATPTTIYFTSAGQVAGVGADVYYRRFYGGAPKQKLVNAGYFLPAGDGRWHVHVAFRDAAAMCDDQTRPEPIGDRLVLNPTGIARALPITEAAAVEEGWYEGSCFEKMGTHYAFDLVGHGREMSWLGENLLPVVTMYDLDGSLSAFFFASTVVQEAEPRVALGSALALADKAKKYMSGLSTDHRELTWFSARQWEPVPLADKLMCGNWCDEDCTFHDTPMWSTMHWWVTNATALTCAKNKVCRLKLSDGDNAQCC